MMSEQRLNSLAATLEAKELDACVVTKTSDIRWLTGFTRVFDDEQAHLALVCRVNGDLQTYLYTDTRYSEALRKRDSAGLWQIYDDKRPRFEHVAKALADIFATGKGRAGELRVAVESDMRLDWFRTFTKAAAEHKGIKLIEEADLLADLRVIKDAEEVEALRAAQAITDAAFSHILNIIRPGVTEQFIATELEYCMRKAGAEAMAFAPIVAAGASSAVPHAKPGLRPLAKGDFVLMDFGAKLGDYCSDMTRTVVLGQASERQRAMYGAVLAAQTAVIEALKPGMLGREAQAIAEEKIAEHGFAGRMIHSLGHGVGLDIHELPVMAPKNETPLKAGHIVTVEPGAYIPDFGGVRIEDFGLMTETGFEAFTKSAHELIEL